jgi:hypothetical protein
MMSAFSPTNRGDARACLLAGHPPLGSSLQCADRSGSSLRFAFFGHARRQLPNNALQLTVKGWGRTGRGIVWRQAPVLRAATAAALAGS